MNHLLITTIVKGIVRLGMTFLVLVISGCVDLNTKIIVPDGYIGAVTLIKSNVKKNEFVLDSNGVGYINEKTFNSLTFKPMVHDSSGHDLSENCVGFSPSTFFGIASYENGSSKRVIEYLSFEIVPDSLIGKKQYYFKDLFKIVDSFKLK